MCDAMHRRNLPTWKPALARASGAKFSTMYSAILNSFYIMGWHAQRVFNVCVNVAKDILCDISEY